MAVGLGAIANPHVFTPVNDPKEQVEQFRLVLASLSDLYRLIGGTGGVTPDIQGAAMAFAFLTGNCA